MGRKSLKSKQSELQNATQEISDTIFGSGAEDLPDGVRTAIEYVAYRAAASGRLKNGQTALFWNLVAVVNRHLKE